MLGAPGLALRRPLLQRRPRFPVLEACGRWEAPASRVLKLWREGLEKDFNPLTARSLVPRAVRRNESSSYSYCGFLLQSKDFFKDLVGSSVVNPGQPE